MGLTRVGVEWILSPISLNNYFFLMAKNCLPYPIFRRISVNVILDKIIVQNFTNFLVLSRTHGNILNRNAVMLNYFPKNLGKNIKIQTKSQRSSRFEKDEILHSPVLTELQYGPKCALGYLLLRL